MRGKPKYLNTKEDYLNLLAMDEVSVEEKKQALEDLLSNISDWFFVGYVAEDSGIEDETHRVIVQENTMGEDESAAPPQYAQYEYRENPMAKIFRIGFTVDEVNDLLAKLG